jgi:predicted dehydrogenase
LEAVEVAMTIGGDVGMDTVLLGEEATSAERRDATSHHVMPTQRQVTTRRRVGVVGLGKQALDDHIPGIAASDLADLVAVCDDDPQVLGQYGDLAVEAYDDFREMFARERLDFVVVTVPHHIGAAVVEAAAEHGVHVLKEKPFATTLAEAQHLARVCADAGIELMVTLQRRFNPIYTSFLQLADQIGTPFMIDAQYTLHIDDPSEGWRGSVAKAGGGCIIDMGYHIIDTLLWYFGLPSRVLADMSVQARPDRSYDAEDSALIHFSYDTGLYGSLLLSRFIGPKNEHIRLIGSKGIVHLERGHIRRLGNNGNVEESLTREQAWKSAAVSQINYFSRVIDGSRVNISSPQHNLDHLRFIDACYASAQTHTYVDLKEAL